MFVDVPIPGLDVPTSVAQELVPITARARRSFWHKVLTSETSTCWFWTGAVSSDGYGRITWTLNGNSRTMGTHRFALTLAHGQLPPGTVAAHGCNNPLCVRVGNEHVHASTQSENIRFAVRSQRHLSNQPRVDSTQRRKHALTTRANHTGLHHFSTTSDDTLFRLP